MYPAFSERACEVLRSFLEPNGELLPIQSEYGGTYFFYNITTVVDALDRENSQCKFSPSRPWVVLGGINYFEFHREKLAGLSVFRIREWPRGMIVSDEFVRRVDEGGLNGFEFVKIWPFERGVNWRRAGRRKTNEKELAMKQHSMVLILPLNGSAPNTSEQRIIKRLESELNARFMVPLDAPFFGWYVRGETADNEYRMFLVCPDVDGIEQELRPWLHELEWPASVRLVKRYGGMHDTSAKETVIEFAGDGDEVILAEAVNDQSEADKSAPAIATRHGISNISETPVPAEMLNNIKGCAGDAAAMLGLELSQTPAAEVIKAVDTFIYDWQQGKRPAVPEGDNLALTLGALWGEQLVRELGWHWAILTFPDDDASKATGVFPQDGALAIYPFTFVRKCLENNHPVTILLAYDMLKDASKIPPLPPGGYADGMEIVHYIVPRG